LWSRGELDAHYRYLFGGLDLTPAAGTTVLLGPVRDDAELYGFLERIAELGLELPVRGEGFERDVRISVGITDASQRGLNVHEQRASQHCGVLLG